MDDFISFLFAAKTAADRAATAADKVATDASRDAAANSAAAAASDAIGTEEHRVAAAASATATAADRVQTGLDATATAADRADVAADLIATRAHRDASATSAAAAAADQVQTGLDAVSTAADRAATAADQVATDASRDAAANSAAAAASDAIGTEDHRVAAAASATATAADRVQTGLDATATAADRADVTADLIATLAHRDASATSAAAAAADRVQTGLDAVSTAADRVQTGLDVLSTRADHIAVAADKATTQSSRDQAAISAQNAADTYAAVLTSANRYPDYATGLAATTSGQYFLVMVPSAGVFAALYRNPSASPIDSFPNVSALNAALAQSASILNGTVPAMSVNGITPAIVYESQDGPQIFVTQAGARSAFVIATTNADGTKRELLRINDAAKTVTFDPAMSVVGNLSLPANIAVTGTLSAADLSASNSTSFLANSATVYEERTNTSHITSLAIGLTDAWTIGGARKILRFDTANDVLRARLPAQSINLPADALVQVSGFPWLNGNAFPAAFPAPIDSSMAQSSDGVVVLPALTSFDTAYATRNHNEAASIARTGARLWATWYSLQTPGGQTAEQYGNYLVLAYSDADGADGSWHEIGYVVPRDPATQRVFDTQVVATPEGRLAILYTQSGGGQVWDEVGGAWIVFINNPQATAAVFEWSEHTFLGNGVPGRPRLFGNELHMSMDYWRIGTQIPIYTARAGKQYCRLITNAPMPRIERIDTIPLVGAAFTGSWTGTTLDVTAVEAGTLAVGQKIDNTSPAATISAFGTGAAGIGTYTLSASQTSPSSSGRKVALIDYDETQVVPLTGGRALAMWRTLDGPYQSIRTDCTWSTPTKVTAFTMAASRNSLARSPSGRLWMMFNNGTSRTNLSLAWLNEATMTWSAAYTFDSAGTRAYPVLDFDSAGNIYGCADDGRGQSVGGPDNIWIYKIPEAVAVAGSGSITISRAAS